MNGEGFPLRLTDILPDSTMLDGLVALTAHVADSGMSFLDHLAADLRAVETGLAACLHGAVGAGHHGADQRGPDQRGPDHTGPDWNRLRAETHVLISLSGAVGADPLMAAARTLNDRAHAQAPHGLEAAIAHVGVMLGLLIGHVDDRRRAQP